MTGSIMYPSYIDMLFLQVNDFQWHYLWDQLFLTFVIVKHRANPDNLYFKNTDDQLALKFTKIMPLKNLYSSEKWNIQDTSLPTMFNPLHSSNNQQ